MPYCFRCNLFTRTKGRPDGISSNMLIQTIQMISASPLLFAALASAATVAPSPKRGLVYTPNKAWPQDDTVWVQAGSDLTWYYNYMPFPSPVYANSLPQSLFEFVPMFWGAPTDPDNTTFLESVKSLVESGTNISHVLGFNEPDGPNYTGGSDVSPAIAANAWVKNMIPLQEMGIRVGLPACTSAPSGLPWIRSFLEECSKLISTGGQKKNCTFDFVPLHYYGKFEGLASHIGEYAAT